MSDTHQLVRKQQNSLCYIEDMHTSDIDSTPISRRCKSQDVLELISDKWSVLVLYTLRRGALRYHELQDLLKGRGLSQKMLTQTLRSLERNGLIDRTVYPVIPPHVEYNQTELGKNLDDLLNHLCGWADKHFDAVIQARTKYDSNIKSPQSP